MSRFSKIAPILLCLMYLPSLWGEYFYDDIPFILQNDRLIHVTSLFDTLDFRVQATRPIPDFWIAFGHWLGGGAPWGQRLLSILVHGTVTALVLVLSGSPVAAALFALSPLASESVLIAQFRSEMLATLFTLAAALCARRARLASTVVFLGLAVLSKEVYAAIAPAVALGAYLFQGGRDRRFIAGLVAASVGWGLTLFHLNSEDAASFSPFGVAVNASVFTHGEHVVFAGRALLEGVIKAVTGTGLTCLRLMTRGGWGSGLSGAIHAMLLSLWVVAMGYGVYRRSLAAGIALAGTVVYLAIPNLNIGAEHYWYFPLVGLAILAGSRVRGPVLAVLATGFFAFQLGSRLAETHTRVRLLRADLARFPGHIDTLIDLANAYGRGNADPVLSRAYLAEAKRVDPRHPRIANEEFIQAMRAGDAAVAEARLADIERTGWTPPRRLVVMYMALSRLQRAQGRGDRADALVQRALSLDPANRSVREAARVHENGRG